MSGQPAPHPLSRRFEVASRDRLAFVTDTVDCHDAPALHKEPEHSCVEFTHVPQFEETIPDCLTQRRAVVLAAPKLRQSSHDCRKVTRIARFQSVQEILNGRLSRVRLVELYC